MRQPAAKDPIIIHRRETVARLLVRGLSARGIAAALPKVDPTLVNPSTGKPYGRTQIIDDVAKVKEQWRANATQAIGEHVAKQLAIIEEVQRKAWAKEDGELVLKCMDRIGKLLGLNAPEHRTVELYPHAPLAGASDEALLGMVHLQGKALPPAVMATLGFEEPAEEQEALDVEVIPEPSNGNGNGNGNGKHA